MNKSADRKRKARAARKAQKLAAMKTAGGASVYALKKKGVFPPNSPHLTGDWGTPIRGLTPLFGQP